MQEKRKPKKMKKKKKKRKVCWGGGQDGTLPQPAVVDWMLFSSISIPSPASCFVVSSSEYSSIYISIDLFMYLIIRFDFF